MTSGESEREARAGTTAAVPDAAGGVAAGEEVVTAEAATVAATEGGSVESVVGAATPETLAEGATPLAGAATPATVHPNADPAAGVARDTMLPPTPLPEEGARIGNSLETIKTAVVWLVVIQILTILSPLLPVSLKWALIVGAVLTLSSFAVAVLAYLKAQRAQRGLPE
jgi:hypothetical protein